MSTTNAKDAPNLDHFVNYLSHEVKQVNGLWSSLRSVAAALESELEPGNAMGHLNAMKFLLDEMAALTTQLDERVGEAVTIRDSLES